MNPYIPFIYFDAHHQTLLNRRSRRHQENTSKDRERAAMVMKKNEYVNTSDNPTSDSAANPQSRPKRRKDYEPRPSKPLVMFKKTYILQLILRYKGLPDFRV